jgi:hypothetical protein
MTGELGIDDSINLGYHEANPNWLVVWNMFFFHNIWDNPSHWLIVFKMVKTTNQQIWNMTCSEDVGRNGFQYVVVCFLEGQHRKNEQRMLGTPCQVPKDVLLPWSSRATGGRIGRSHLTAATKSEELGGLFDAGTHFQTISCGNIYGCWHQWLIMVTFLIFSL